MDSRDPFASLDHTVRVRVGSLGSLFSKSSFGEHAAGESRPPSAGAGPPSAGPARPFAGAARPFAGTRHPFAPSRPCFGGIGDSFRGSGPSFRGSGPSFRAIRAMLPGNHGLLARERAHASWEAWPRSRERRARSRQHARAPAEGGHASAEARSHSCERRARSRQGCPRSREGGAHFPGNTARVPRTHCPLRAMHPPAPRACTPPRADPPSRPRDPMARDDDDPPESPKRAPRPLRPWVRASLSRRDVTKWVFAHAKSKVRAGDHEQVAQDALGEAVERAVWPESDDAAPQRRIRTACTTTSAALTSEEGPTALASDVPRRRRGRRMPAMREATSSSVARRRLGVAVRRASAGCQRVPQVGRRALEHERGGAFVDEAPARVRALAHVEGARRAVWNVPVDAAVAAARRGGGRARDGVIERRGVAAPGDAGRALVRVADERLADAATARRPPGRRAA